MPNPWAPRRIDGDGGGSSKRLSVARPRRRRARPNAPCAMLHRGDAGILRSLSLMIPSSPRLVAFAQSECDLTTPILTPSPRSCGSCDCSYLEGFCCCSQCSRLFMLFMKSFPSRRTHTSPRSPSPTRKVCAWVGGASRRRAGSFPLST